MTDTQTIYLPGQTVVYHLRRFDETLYMCAQYNGYSQHDRTRHQITIIKRGVAHKMKQVRTEQLSSIAEYYQNVLTRKQKG